MSLDANLFAAGLVAEAAVVGLLLYRRVWRTLPFFCVYSAETLVGSVLAYVVLQRFPAHYFSIYFGEAMLDSVLQFCVLVELAWSVFRPLRKSLPHSTVWVLGIAIAIVGACIWPFADSTAFAHFPFQWHLLGKLQQTVSILRILFFLVLAGCSQLLSIGWRDRELQVATGLGFYSLVDLATTVMHSHQMAGQEYRRLDQLLVASFVCSSIYWVVSFAQREAERREFTPQMQSLLLTVAGAARTNRVALAQGGSSDGRNAGDQ